MNVPTWGWYLTIGLMTVVLLIDVFIIARRPHVPTMREASRHLVFYIGAAVLFGLFVWRQWGGQYAGEFYAGWADLAGLIQELTTQMHQAATELHFELPARLRDEIQELKKELRQLSEATR